MSFNTFSNLISLAGDDPDTYSNGGRAIYDPSVEELLAMSTLLLQGIKVPKGFAACGAKLDASRQTGSCTCTPSGTDAAADLTTVLPALAGGP